MMKLQIEPKSHTASLITPNGVITSYTEEPETTEDSSLDVSNSDAGFLSMIISPEIRKDSIWEIQFKLGNKLIKTNDIKNLVLLNIKKNLNLNHFSSKEYYLDLKVRSKLSKPVKEVPFEKVGVVVNDTDFIDVHKDTAVLRVKFTQRPRSVFHKQSDVMILVATIQRGSNVVCTSTSELIFRGGTGSVHSADHKKKKRTGKSDSKQSSPNTHIIIPENNYSQLANFPTYQEGTTVITSSDFETTSFIQDFMNNGGQKCVTNYQNEHNLAPIDFSLFYQNMANFVSQDQQQMMQMGYPMNDGSTMNFNSMTENNYVDYQNNGQPILNNFEQQPESNVYEDDEFKSPIQDFSENFNFQDKVDPSLQLNTNNSDFQNNIPMDNNVMMANNNMNNMMQGLSFSLKGAKVEDGKWKAEFEGFINSQNFVGTMTGFFDSEGFHGNFDAKFN